MINWYSQLREQLEKNYILDNDNGIWIRKSFEGILYTDGDSIEKKIYEIIKSSKDKGVYSDELRSKIEDWPSEYHLSASRHLSVKPIFESISRVNTILEVGSGCGAISRYLSDNCNYLVCLEGSVQRAIITAERCKGLNNVIVICDNFFNLALEIYFDIVTLIGVLEYANLYVKKNKEDNVKKCLSSANNKLNANGKLILAIENQLGLKYFNGCSEDHINIPFYGINNLYDTNTAVTFGKYDLLHKLNISGFNFSEIIYPFPDYKIPVAVIFQDAYKNESLNISDIMGSIKSKSYDNNNLRMFNEKLALDVLLKNKLAQDLSNSFIVVSSRTNIEIDKSLLAVTYTASRKSSYITETKFSLKCGDILVTKNHLNNIVNNNNIFEHKITKEKKYIKGKLLSSYIVENFSRNNDIDNLVELLGYWVDYLIKNSTFIKNNEGIWSAVMEGSFWDCLPNNLVLDCNDNLNYIDDEWHVNNKIPTAYVILRGLIATLHNLSFFIDSKIKYIEVYDRLLDNYNLKYTKEDIIYMSKFDENMVSSIFFKKNRIKDFIYNEVYKSEANILLRYKEYQMDNKKLKRLNNHILFGCLIKFWRLIKKDPNFAKPF
jgi:hypothetical protein